MRILLVDDSELMLRLEALFLEGDHDVVTAKSGAEALIRAVAERPDLVLMDLNMPEMDGREAARQLQRLDASAGIPVVLVTTAEQIASGGGDEDYLVKPFDAKALRGKVGQYASPAARAALRCSPECAPAA